MILALWAQGIAAISICTLIILVQVLVYPQFGSVGHKELTHYATDHVRRISYVVGPIMLVESLSLIVLWTFPAMRTTALYCATASLILVWLLTFIKIIPIHKQLETVGDPHAIPVLVRLNAYRTGLWLFKTLAIVYMLIQHSCTRVSLSLM